MKLIIAGGRYYAFTEADREFLDSMLDEVTEVVSGGATGADKCGELWANLNGIPIKLFAADWNLLGRKAGPIRNQQMAEYADAVVLFPGGKGTESMYNNAKKYGLKIFDRRYN
jgi:hypothetical protein